MTRMLTVTDIATICDVAPTTVRSWHDRGYLPAATIAPPGAGPGKPALSWPIEEAAAWIAAYHARTAEQIEVWQRRLDQQEREMDAWGITG